MAKKLKRIDGVSNSKTARTPASKEASKVAKGRTQAEARATEQQLNSAADRTRVEKRRKKAAAKARTNPEPPAVARGRKPAVKVAKTASPEKKAKTAQRLAKNEAPENKKKPSREEKAPRSWRVLSPRVVVPVILLAVFIALSASPVARNLEATGKLKAMERELVQQKKTTESLAREVAQARSLDYIEQEARRQRMVGPGEILYLVTTEAEGPDVEYRMKALQSMDEAWERVRQMLHCNAERQVNEQ